MNEDVQNENEHNNENKINNEIKNDDEDHDEVRLRLTPGVDQPNVLTAAESLAIKHTLEELVEKLWQKKRSFKDKSRFFCCGCFSICVSIFMIVFYIFDVLKYEETCKQSKKLYVEICEAPSIGFWPRFFFVSVSVAMLIFGVYCTGPTVLIFDPENNKLLIDKKKLFCLPSICEYPLDQLLRVEIEDDQSDGAPNLSTFNFHSVVLVFKNNSDSGNIVNLGLGRDCFYREEKIELKNKINKYLQALSLKYNNNSN
jgi:hypothetical protein